jgi:predicted anti-sigma-YlaC factor YlaD
MKELSCEDVLRAQMAATDGEEPGLSKELLAAHVAGCANCRRELEQLQAIDQMLASHTLREQHIDLWPAIENRITKRVLGWQPFALIGVLLVIIKLLEMLPAHDLGIGIKLVPLVIVALLFVLIKENPFRINTELVMER